MSRRELERAVNHVVSECNVAKLQIEKALLEVEGMARELEGRSQDIYACLRMEYRARSTYLSEEQIFGNSDLDDGRLSYDEQLLRLKALEPQAFPHWWGCFEAGRLEYERTERGNLSTADHPIAQEFGEVVVKYAVNRVLDIGCGPQMLPSYLRSVAGRDDVRIYGVDPLPGDHPFPCYRGFVEYLPWKEGSFETVVCGTSLDHCLSLTKALTEIHRVMCVGGVFLVWVGFVNGASEYNPKSANITPLDDYHLFHFDRPWFEELMTQYFSIREVAAASDGLSVFYAFQKS